MRAALLLCLCLTLAGCGGGGRPDPRRAAFLGTSAQPSAVIATELAFARMARDEGQWSAFREFAAPDAVWPAPQWTGVQAMLKGLADPGQAIVWEPDRVWMSCDGSFALSTGPAAFPDGHLGRFTTIWQRQEDGAYRWVLDQGFEQEAGYEKPEMIAALVADCEAGPGPHGPQHARGGHDTPPVNRGLAWQSGESNDGTLDWSSKLAADCSRTLVVRARQRGEMQEVFRRSAPPPPTKPGAAAPVCAG